MASADTTNYLPQSWEVVRIGVRDNLLQNAIPEEYHLASPQIPLNDIHRKAVQTLHKKAIVDGELRYKYWARLLWDSVLFPQRLGEDSDSYQRFVTTLLFGLRRMDIKKCVYPEVFQVLPELIAKYGKDVAEVVIWSAGDEESYGQVMRILRSGIPAKIEELTHGNSSVQQKFKWLVRTRKEEALAKYIDTLVVDATRDTPVKLVVIEDSIRVLETVKTTVSKYVSQGICSYTPILATYAAKNIPQARDSSVAVPRDADDLILLTSVHDLLNSEKFGDLIKEAHVFCDFDGPLINNSNTEAGTGWLRTRAVVRAMISMYMSEASVNEETATTAILQKLESQVS